MRLDLTGRHLDITPILRRLVQSKLRRLERILKDTALSAQVVLSTQRALHHVDVTLHARGDRFLHSAGKGEDFRAAMVDAVNKLVQQGTTNKGKWQERKRPPRARARAAVRGRPLADRE